MPATASLVIAGAALIALPQATADRAQARAVPDAPAALAMDIVDTVAATAAAPETPSDTRPEVFAAVDGVELRLPAADVVAHGFHEAGGDGPLPLAPVGTWQQAGDGAGNGFDAGAIASPDGPEFLVMPSRGRGQDPTSAADVVVEGGEPVLAPVDGVVTTVADYQLYGDTPDTLIYITPDAAPHLQVELLHVDEAMVAEGDRVVAGETAVAGTARQLSFPSQIDRFVGAALPHVHVEVTSRGVAA